MKAKGGYVYVIGTGFFLILVYLEINWERGNTSSLF